jgi:hypothetical protein
MYGSGYGSGYGDNMSGHGSGYGNNMYGNDSYNYGSPMTSYNYSGCHPMCSGGCTGSTVYDCKACCAHSHMMDDSYCMCEAGYSGDDCSIYSHSYTCSPRCYGGCTGPDACDCIDCIGHSFRDEYNYCTCDPFWAGDDCVIYRGPCNSKCYGCNGPDSDDCRYCVPHAHWNNDGSCECDSDWTGDDCSAWNGTCDDKCEVG